MGALSAEKIFIQHPLFFPTVLKCQKIAVNNSLFFKIAGAKAPIAPMLNMHLMCIDKIWYVKSNKFIR